MRYAIGSQQFYKWTGPEPGRPRQHLTEFRKVGQAGVALQLQGIFGDPFDVELHAAFANRTLAQTADVAYAALIHTIANVTFEDIDYGLTHGLRFEVLSAQTRSIQQRPLVQGPGYRYAPGWVVLSSWRLIAIID